MVTVIDALVVTLGLDNTNFQRNQKESTRSLDQFSDKAQSDAKNIQRATRQMTQGFRAIRNELVGMLAFSVGGYGAGNLIANTIGDQAQLGRLSEDLRMSTRDADAWSRAMRSVGGTANDARQSMTSIADAIQAFALGQDSSTVPYLRSLGIEVASDRGTPRAPQDILMDMAKAFEDLSPMEQRNVSQATGVTEKMMYFLRQGLEEVTSSLQRARNASNVTPDSVEQSRRAQEAFAELGNEINGIYQTLYVSATPAMGELNESLDRFASWLQENRTEVEQFFTGMVEGGESLSRALSDFEDITDGATGKVMAMAAAIAALAAAAGLIGGAGRGGGILAALGLAGGAGVLAGNEINERYIEGSGFEDEIGKYVAKWLDFWGFSDQANQALRQSGDENAFNLRDIQSGIKRMFGGSSGDENEMISWFMGNGWSRAQAVGIVSNLKAESSLDPTAVGDGGKAYGLAQWHPDRQRNFQRWAGKSIRESTLEEQMAFVNYEMRFGQEKAAGRALMGARTAEEAAAIVSRRYERPANGELQAQRRAEMASGMYGSTHGLMPLGATSRPGMRDGGSTVSNSSEVHIGEIRMYTSATDADGIARDMGESLRRNSLIDGGTTGMH